MSFFNKVLGSFGIGGAKVDTKLERSEYTAGENMNGQVEVYGGKVDQQVDSIYLTVYTTYIRESDDKKYTDVASLIRHKINEPFTIGAGETKSIPFSMVLPVETPITFGNTRVWVGTGLDIKNAVDAEDKDYIDVRPTKIAARILGEMEQLGFKLRKAECEQASRKMRSRHPFVQEFEFIPTSGVFRGRLDELDVVFLSQSEQSADLLLEVDRKARGFGGFLAEALEMDESQIRLSVTTQDLPNLAEKLKQVISNYI
ncbi:sporulation protein [Sporosarcina sp. ANT_H38]|uniref:sporulation protein n=1 Tax=Sporosarcina sp. ANT_H38 TaxID=2597358 RepID=UPI0011F20B8A|nr:sporulation protein [Sporosarcina sp. ANT_H38]KAA0942086.1 sporulation protein [Sporosarcina sp. ANT_H38]